MLLASPDTFIDFASLTYNVSTGNYAAARWDAVSLMVPGLTGLGALNRAGDALQTVNRLDTFYDTGHALNTASNVSYTTRYSDNVVRSLPNSCLNSFSADTEVATNEGDKPISQIQIGDYVLAWDEETNSISFYPVTDTIHHTDEIVVHLTIDGEELETTPEHPFFVEGEGWVEAEDLQVGDDIRNADGSTGEIESIEFEQTQQEMYNLTVDEAHTFFVGDGQWLVHNCPSDWGAGMPGRPNIVKQAIDPIESSWFNKMWGHPKSRNTPGNMEGMINRLFDGDLIRYDNFLNTLDNSMPINTSVILRGSAVNGYKWVNGVPFDSGSILSDIDLVLVGKNAMNLWPNKNFVYFGNQTPFMSTEFSIFDSSAPNMYDLILELERQAGRGVNFVGMTESLFRFRTLVQRYPYFPLIVK